MRKELMHEQGGECQNQLEAAILQVLKYSLYLPIVTDPIPPPYCEEMAPYPEVQCKTCGQTAATPAEVKHTESETYCYQKYKITVLFPECATSPSGLHEWPEGTTPARRHFYTVSCRYCGKNIGVQPTEGY